MSRRLLFLAFATAAVLFSVLLYNGRNTRPSNVNNHSVNGAIGNEADHVGQVDEGMPVPLRPSRIVAPKVSPEDNLLITECNEKLEASLKAVELGNRTRLYDKKNSATRIIVEKVVSPTQEQIDAIYFQFSQAVKSIRSGGATAEAAMTQRLKQTIDSYFVFPKSIKFLFITLGNEEQRVLEVWECYVDDESLLVFRESGGFDCPPIDDRSVVREESVSWWAGRYSHILPKANDVE